MCIKWDSIKKAVNHEIMAKKVFVLRCPFRLKVKRNIQCVQFDSRSNDYNELVAFSESETNNKQCSVIQNRNDSYKLVILIHC